ncbi:Lipase, GDSL [Artemisia annua]|uniref:Lipase, GDSL n=1 Tax=Artemisia annua TaxID=35608 RepID=A0A2U1MTK2_ARTAN|nr:Lipase, GDSL [Artemisia annua]
MPGESEERYKRVGVDNREMSYGGRERKVVAMVDIVCSSSDLTLGSTRRQFVTPWCKSIPKKVCVFIWRLYHGRFPVRTILGDIGIDHHTLFCPCCNDVIESMDHCFVLCPKDVLNLHGIDFVNSIIRERWEAVIWSTLYMIWSNRNQMIFRRNGSMIPDLFKEIQLQPFEWISARSKKDEVKREEWFGGPIHHV